MFRIKKFLSITILVVLVLIGAFLPTRFSVAQNYGLTVTALLGNSLRFIMPNNPVYLYILMEPNTYTIHFDGNGSTSGNMSAMDMIYGISENLIPNNFTRDGYVFQGWSSSKTGAVEYLDQSEVQDLVMENGGEITLYAQRITDVQVPYIIEYYQENIAGTGYDLVGTGIGYGTAGTGIVLTGKMYTGFTLQTGAEVVISSGGVVPYYYTRNTYDLTLKDRDEVLFVTGIKYGDDIRPILPESLTGWTGNAFSGWNNVPEGGLMPANNLEITSEWTYGVHSITFDTDGGSEIAMITGNYGDPIVPPSNPTKSGYEFVGWSPSLPTTIPYDDIVVKAVWREIGSKGNGWSGRGRSGGGSPDNSGGEGQHGSSIENVYTGINRREDNIDLETFFAYMWAHDMGIIEESWEDSDPDGYVTRGAMAEMVVKFTEKVLGKGIPSIIPAKCAWGDAESEWKSPETKVYAQKACALGVMGIRMQDFMPNKILDRAEFGTILSRLLWGDKYDVVDATKTKLYYTRHLEALNEKKIMLKIDNPESKKELRKWAWLMLMRSRIEERLMN